MKRYLVFTGGVYYPLGGWDDFQGDYDTLEEAKARVKERHRNDWAQIIDTTTKQEVTDPTS